MKPARMWPHVLVTLEDALNGLTSAQIAELLNKKPTAVALYAEGRITSRRVAQCCACYLEPRGYIIGTKERNKPTVWRMKPA